MKNIIKNIDFQKLNLWTRENFEEVQHFLMGMVIMAILDFICAIIFVILGYDMLMFWIGTITSLLIVCLAGYIKEYYDGKYSPKAGSKFESTEMMITIMGGFVYVLPNIIRYL